MSEFDEKLASGLVKEYGLGAHTLAVWKNRGTIPNRYLDGTAFKRKGKITRREMDRLVRVLKSDKINLNRFFENCKTIKVTDYYDYVKIGACIDRVQYIEIKKVLNTLRVELKVLYASKNFEEDLKKWLNDNGEFFKSLVFDRKALDFKRGRVTHIDERIYLSRLGLLVLETSLD